MQDLLKINFPNISVTKILWSKNVLTVWYSQSKRAFTTKNEGLLNHP